MDLKAESVEIRFENGKMKVGLLTHIYDDRGKIIGEMIIDIPNVKMENGDILAQLNNDNEKGDNYIPECCKGCYNLPSNGGSGICNCTTPLYDEKYPWKMR